MLDLRIPQLKVGTLDALVQISDDLAKIDGFGEGVSHKVSQFLSDLLSGDKDKLAESLTVNGRTLETYVTRFEWDSARFNTGGFVKDVAGDISQKLSTIESELKTRMQAFNKIKSSVQALERKSTGTLLTRSLAELVKPEHFIRDSEYLITLVVVVPRPMYAEWLATYHTLTEFVVPRSSELMFEDNDYGLYSVTVFRKIEQDFKTAARDKKFTVRDFEFSQEDIQAQKAELSTLQSDLTKRALHATQWCKSAFSDAFSSWLHIKVLRVFVESVLRYGLPINFDTVVVQTHKGRSKTARKALQTLYAHLDAAAGGREVALVEVAGVGMGSDYQPYVTFTVDLAKFPV